MRRAVARAIEVQDLLGGSGGDNRRRWLAAIPEAPDFDVPALAVFGWRQAAAQISSGFAKYVDSAAGRSKHGPAVRFIKAALEKAGFGAMITLAAIEKRLSRRG
jgi:hypothetical protein